MKLSHIPFSETGFQVSVIDICSIKIKDNYMGFVFEFFFSEVATCNFRLFLKLHLLFPQQMNNWRAVSNHPSLETNAESHKQVQMGNYGKGCRD